ncbi:predicted protein [Chaetomium globosum CBS 148.51]|uniref:Uncharacterized protein n=1 Tax=Chaetomium globosum (strain ATCC 6205 / CBS 148.51 / DSM 1962 / NBRC 6347 / NRRL 1970) TaxID=306901 RepID=Q2GXA6_CHAGB|nr:uncharacterized protein CHGG_07398 [Chaetomium globosum CBS 148.51]EAQ86145.1 predicted protein [Chaetomium globosum CBS 148.51]
MADVLEFAHRQVNRLAPPNVRRDMWIRTQVVYAEQPLRFTFYLAQAFFASIPVLCFLTFGLFVFFTLITGVLFLTLFWVGLASCLLVPILVVTFCMASCTWGFGIALFRLGPLAYGALKTAFVIGRREFRDLRRRYDAEYPALPAPAPPPVANPGGPARPKSSRGSKSSARQARKGKETGDGAMNMGGTIRSEAPSFPLPLLHGGGDDRLRPKRPPAPELSPSIAATAGASSSSLGTSSAMDSRESPATSGDKSPATAASDE